MATALSATGRITLSYTITGKTHKAHFYVRGLTAVGSTWNINSRTLDANDIDWTSACDKLVEALSNWMASGQTWNDAVLEQLSGLVWLPRATHTPSFTNHGSSTAALGWGCSLVLRDINFKKIKVLILEGNQGTLSHQSAYANLAGGNLAAVKEFTANKTLNPAPYDWMVGRGNQYINTTPFVGTTVSPNRKLRRARGLT